MKILGIETSCDETAAAVVEDRERVLSNRVASQVDVHRLYGGVVPELASRCHLEAIEPVVRDALDESGCDFETVDGIAVTSGPGLVGALLVGLSFAKAAAFVARKPLVGVNHIEGHIRAAFIEEPDIAYPGLALVVSGGHTALYFMPEEGTYRLLARTRDDAAGEAYDKVGKLLGLGYPGGPVIDRISGSGDSARFDLPRPRMSDGSLDFSFSGLKTAVLRIAQRNNLVSAGHRSAGSTGSAAAASPASPTSPANSTIAGSDPAASITRAGTHAAGGERRRGSLGSPFAPARLVDATPAPGATGTEDVPKIVRDICASFQEAVVDVLCERTLRAAETEGARAVILSGGVACNTRLRARLEEACTAKGLAFHRPSPRYCTDNAAMIAAAGFLHLERGDTAGFDLNADAGLRLGGPEAIRKTLRHR